MGQYYHGVILDAETRKPIMATYPVLMKMAESGLWDVCRIAYEVSKGRQGYKQRVTWAGDYSERKDYDGETLYRYILNNSVPETMGKEYKKYPIKGSKFSEAWFNSIDAFFRQYVTDEKDIIRPEYRYLCNHDRREWIGKKGFDLDYTNAQGDPGNTRMLAFNANFSLYLSHHLLLDIRGSYFMRHAHYRDFADVSARTFEIRGGLTYKL